MSNLISRQRAVEIIQNMYPGIPRIPWMIKNWKKKYEPYIRLEEEIKALPAAELETCAYWDRESNFCALHRPSAQPANSDKISYSVICEKFPSPHVYFNTYDEAEHWAKFNQPNYRPYYIIKCSEHFETVGEVR